MRAIQAADLFCGGGGTTTGLLQACRRLNRKVALVAVNHWAQAIQTHMRNHPWARHICASLDGIDPPADGQKTLFQCVDSVEPNQALKGKKLNLLIASPECTHHSNARGGRPRSDQSRATPWCILRWMEAGRPGHVIIENVPEFQNWGPLGTRGQPLKSRKGDTFNAFLNAMGSLGYTVEHRVLNCADFGDPTTRRRLFIRAQRTGKIRWPDRSHAPRDEADELGLKPWKPARDVIDWSINSRSIFSRKKPLAPKTMKRIAAGIEKYWGEWAQPFLVMMYGTSTARPLDEPMPTVTAQGQHLYLAEPFLIPQHGGGAPRKTGEPVPTVATAGAISMVEPFLVKYHGGKRYVRTRSIDEPLPTQDTSNRFALAEPFMMEVNHGGADSRTQDINRPIPTLTAKNGRAVVEPFLVPQFGERPTQTPRTHGVGEPLPTVTSHGAGALVEPFIAKYYGTGKTKEISEPLDTVTSRDRFALIEPGIVQDESGTRYELDIRFRMLAPNELAAAMSFPDGYEFLGNKSEVVKQIGNAVPIKTAEALCLAALKKSG